MSSGGAWNGPRFDTEALRRPPYPEPPPPGSRPELIQRHREVTAEFPTMDLPPLETAYWLVKPPSLVRGTWDEPEDAAAWIGERVAEYAPRFASERERSPIGRPALINSAVVRLRSGCDISFGFYLERPSYLSLTVVTCSPNRSVPALTCPVMRSG